MTANRIDDLARKLADATIDHWRDQGFDLRDQEHEARAVLAQTLERISTSGAVLVATLNRNGDTTRLEHRYLGPFGVELVVDMVASMPVIGANLAAAARKLDPKGLAAHLAQLGQAGRIVAPAVAGQVDELASARKRRQNAGERSLDSSERGKPARDVGQSDDGKTTGTAEGNKPTGEKNPEKLPN